VEITNIQIRLRNEDKLKGFVNVTFDDCFVVRGCKIIQGNKGYFVSMPSQKQEDGTHRDIAHPINPEMRQVIEDRVLKAYVAELRSRGMLQPSPTAPATRPAAAPDMRTPAPGGFRPTGG
jgi:stage V sporulation protein G